MPRGRAGCFPTLGIRSHRLCGRRVDDPIFDHRETAMGPRNSHLETLRRTQTVGDCSKRTVSEAYPCMTSTGHTPCTPQRLRVELEQRISTHEGTLEKAVRNNPGEGGSEHGTMDQRKHHLTAIGVRG